MGKTLKCLKLLHIAETLSGFTAKNECVKCNHLEQNMHTAYWKMEM